MNKNFFEEIEFAERNENIKPWFAVNVRSELLERDSTIIRLQENLILRNSENSKLQESILNLQAENKRLKGESEIQRGFFNAAMDRLEKAESAPDHYKKSVNDLYNALDFIAFFQAPNELWDKTDILLTLQRKAQAAIAAYIKASKDRIMKP